MAQLSKQALDYFKEQGRRGGLIGGKIAAANMTDAERKARALKAVVAREKKRAEKSSK